MRLAEGDLLGLRRRLDSRFLLLPRSRLLRLPFSSRAPSFVFSLLPPFLSRPGCFAAGFSATIFFLLAEALLLPLVVLVSFWLVPFSRLLSASFVPLVAPPSAPLASFRSFALPPLDSFDLSGALLLPLPVALSLLVAPAAAPTLLERLSPRLPSLPLSSFLTPFPFSSFFPVDPGGTFLLREDRSLERSSRARLLLLLRLAGLSLPTRSEPLPPPRSDPLRLGLGLREGLRFFPFRLSPSRRLAPPSRSFLPAFSFRSRLRLGLRLPRLLLRSLLPSRFASLPFPLESLRLWLPTSGGQRVHKALVPNRSLVIRGGTQQGRGENDTY